MEEMEKTVAEDLAAARAAAREYATRFGEPDPLVLAQVRDQLAKAGVGRPEPPEEASAREAALARLRGLAGQRRTELRI